MGKPDNGSVCLRGKLFTCSNYGMWNKVFPYRLCFWIPHFFLDTLRSKCVTVIVLEPYLPIGYVWYGMLFVYVGSSYLGVVVLGSWQFACLLFDGCSERSVGRGQARQWVCLPRGQVVHLF